MWRHPVRDFSCPLCGCLAVADGKQVIDAPPGACDLLVGLDDEGCVIFDEDAAPRAYEVLARDLRTLMCVRCWASGPVEDFLRGADWAAG